MTNKVYKPVVKPFLSHITFKKTTKPFFHVEWTKFFISSLAGIQLIWNKCCYSKLQKDYYHTSSYQNKL